MRDYQLAGLKWLIRLYENGDSGILADEMGLDKRLPTISLLKYLKESRGITGPHMVVAPKSTVSNWMNEICQFCPMLRAVKFLGDPKQRRDICGKWLVDGKFDVVVTSFEMAIKEKATLHRFKNWRYIIIDEADRMKDETTVLSNTMRLYNSDYRLLIINTPLQNNLHELRSLQKFLLPQISERFDGFQISGENALQEVVQQLHELLHPLLLRRLRSDVEKGLPPKKGTILKVGMSQMQKQRYRDLLLKNQDLVNAGGAHRRLHDFAMELRKCCNHPYLVPGPPPTAGDHLIENAGKMVLLDKLLRKLKERDSRVLIFSQMEELLDILEEYLMYRGYLYCRIDENTRGEERDASIGTFNKLGSEKFVFLLSTRAGDLGISLATADVVVHYDSDWDPQVDLQAQDLAQGIGQKKEVQVFRFCTEYTIEEKVIERAYKKLALDALVVQQRRLAEQKSETVNKDELLQMVRFGVEMVFSSENSTITDDIDRIIAKGEEATAEIDAKMKKFTENAINFGKTGAVNFYDFEEEKGEDKFDFNKVVLENWIGPSKAMFSKSKYFKQAMRQSDPTELPHGVHPFGKRFEATKIGQEKVKTKEVTKTADRLMASKMVPQQSPRHNKAGRGVTKKSFPEERQHTAAIGSSLAFTRKRCQRRSPGNIATTMATDGEVNPGEGSPAIKKRKPLEESSPSSQHTVNSGGADDGSPAKEISDKGYAKEIPGYAERLEEEPERRPSLSSPEDSDSETDEEGSRPRGFGVEVPTESDFPDSPAIRKTSPEGDADGDTSEASSSTPSSSLPSLIEETASEAAEASSFTPSSTSAAEANDFAEVGRSSSLKRNIYEALNVHIEERDKAIEVDDELHQSRDGILPKRAKRAVNVSGSNLQPLSDSNGWDGVESAISQLALDLDSGMTRVRNRATSQILADTSKLSDIIQSKQKSLDMRYEELHGQLNAIHGRFKDEVYRELKDYISFVKDLDAHSMEMEKQAASLSSQFEEVEIQLTDAQDALSGLTKLARERRNQFNRAVAEDDELASAISRLALSVQILTSAGEEGISFKLQNAEAGLKLKSIIESNRKRRDMRREALKEKLKAMHARFENEVNHHLEDYISLAKGLVVHHLQLRRTVEKQGVYDRDLLLEADETIEKQFSDVKIRTTEVNDLARDWLGRSVDDLIKRLEAG